jgi:hypothetical protein
MKSLAIAALVAAQIMVGAQPAMAAGLGDDRTGAIQQQGAFAGARLRVPLGGEGKKKARAGLAVAPVLHSRQADGSVRTRFGEGMEYGFAGGHKAELSLAGRPISQVAQGRTGPDGRKQGVSTIGWIAIGVGALAAVVLIAGVICLSDDDCVPSE